MLSTALSCYVRRNRLCLISSVGHHSTNEYIQLLLMLNGLGDKSFVDDLVASGYCKCESSLCCYEALRFIPCFYDLFFFVFKISTCDFSRFGIQLREEFHQIWDFQFWGFCVCKNRRPFSVGSAFPFLPFKKSVCISGFVTFLCQKSYLPVVTFLSSLFFLDLML